MEEMNTIKDDMQFILDNKKSTKSPINLNERKKERMETSYSNISLSENMNNSLINSTSILNNSNFYENNNNNINNITCYNLNEKMEQKQLTKFQEFLNGFNSNKNVLLLVDSRSKIWEIIKRNDLDVTKLSNDEYVNSCCSIFSKDKFNEDNKILDEKLMNIEIKENEDKSFINSELDISKVSDMNISQLIRDTNNNETMEN